MSGSGSEIRESAQFGIIRPVSVFDYVLDGLEAALELERELGVRTVECDRGLLADDPARLTAGGVALNLGVDKVDKPDKIDRVVSVDKVDRPAAVNQNLKTSEPQNVHPLVFLHDRPLLPAGVEMMAKILNALGKPDAPIVVTPPVPQAKVTVVLGGLALKKYFPGMRGEPGQWQKTPDGRDVLITYSPAYILRFGTVTPAVQKIKQDMWLSLKAVKQRLVS